MATDFREMDIYDRSCFQEVRHKKIIFLIPRHFYASGRFKDFVPLVVYATFGRELCAIDFAFVGPYRNRGMQNYNINDIA